MDHIEKRCNRGGWPGLLWLLHWRFSKSCDFCLRPKWASINDILAIFKVFKNIYPYIYHSMSQNHRFSQDTKFFVMCTNFLISTTCGSKFCDYCQFVLLNCSNFCQKGIPLWPFTPTLLHSWYWNYLTFPKWSFCTLYNFKIIFEPLFRPFFGIYIRLFLNRFRKRLKMVEAEAVDIFESGRGSGWSH